MDNIKTMELIKILATSRLLQSSFILLLVFLADSPTFWVPSFPACLIHKSIASCLERIILVTTIAIRPMYIITAPHNIYAYNLIPPGDFLDMSYIYVLKKKMFWI